MANLLHIKGSRTQIYKTLPSTSVGNDGDIILSTIQGRGVYLCSKVNGRWYVSNKMEELRKIEKTSIKDLKLDRLKIGNTTITRNEYDVSSGDFSLDVAGNITLDSATGVFIAQKDGTEFSVADSAYAGMILGYTAIKIDAADASYDVTSAFVTINVGAKVTFVAPPSGNVEIFVSVFNDCAASGRPFYLGLSDNATYNAVDVTHEHEALTGDETDEYQVNHYWAITWLTAGTSYTWWIGAKSSHNSIHVLRWGGDVTAEYAPFIIKATALPATIYDGT